MYCPNCGKQVQEGDRFCPYCDRRRTEAAAETGSAPAAGEQLLFSFGPFATDVCDGPFKIFGTWHRRNSVIVELTNTRLCALPNRKFGLLTIPAARWGPGIRLPFEIPYDSIESVEVQKHPSPIALMVVLDIKYRQGRAVLETCIASYKNNIQRAYQIITGERPGRHVVKSPAGDIT
jgi:zinc-ribbon domain